MQSSSGSKYLIRNSRVGHFIESESIYAFVLIKKKLAWIDDVSIQDREEDIILKKKTFTKDQYMLFMQFYFTIINIVVLKKIK